MSTRTSFGPTGTSPAVSTCSPSASATCINHKTSIRVSDEGSLAVRNWTAHQRGVSPFRGSRRRSEEMVVVALSMPESREGTLFSETKVTSMVCTWHQNDIKRSAAFICGCPRISNFANRTRVRYGPFIVRNTGTEGLWCPRYRPEACASPPGRRPSECPCLLET